MNYGTVSHIFSIVSLYSCKENLYKDHSSLTDSTFVMNDERTPLIIRTNRRNAHHYDPIINWKVFSLILIFIMGLSIGIYLLTLEYHEQRINFRYNLIELNVWHREYVDASLFSNETALQLPVTNIIVSHTQGKHCYSTKMCSILINNMIEDDLLDIPYNFLISSSGDSYEVRGWNYASGFPIDYNKTETIVVAFIGNFTTNVPTDKQLAELTAFINEGIRRKQLKKNFNLYGVQSGDQEKIMLHERLREVQQFSGIL